MKTFDQTLGFLLTSQEQYGYWLRHLLALHLKKGAAAKGLGLDTLTLLFSDGYVVIEGRNLYRLRDRILLGKPLERPCVPGVNLNKIEHHSYRHETTSTDLSTGRKD